MTNAINSSPQSYSGVTINCNVIDPTKLPPDSPLLKIPPQYTIEPNNKQMGNCNCGAYPPNYYTNIYGYPSQEGVNMARSGKQQTIETPEMEKKRIVPLSDDYIKSLENALNDSNKTVRESAAREVMNRFKEDEERYDDPALNALLNKMLQDPTSKTVRTLAYIILDTDIAKGNKNTAKILKNIAENRHSIGGMEELDAKKLLLKVSAPTEVIEVPKKTKKASKE